LRCWREVLELREVSETPRSKCRYLDKEMPCDVEVNDKEITLRNLREQVIATLRFNDILSIEQKGNEFIIMMKNGDRVSIMITRELLKRIMYVTTLLELRSSAKEALLALKECLLTLSKVISLLEEIMMKLRRGSIPDWGRINEISAELKGVVLSELLKKNAKAGIGEVANVLEELSKNARTKYVNGIRRSARKLVGIVSDECVAKLSRILASVNLAVAVDVMLYIHSYCFAGKFGMRLEADTSKARIVDALSELLSNVFWLGGDELEKVTTAVLKSLNDANANKSVEVFVNELIKGICSHYSMACPENVVGFSAEE